MIWLALLDWNLIYWAPIVVDQEMIFPTGLMHRFWGWKTCDSMPTQRVPNWNLRSVFGLAEWGLMQAKNKWKSERHCRRIQLNDNKTCMNFWKKNYLKFQVNYAYLAEDENSGKSKVLLCLEIWYRTVRDSGTRIFEKKENNENSKHQWEGNS